MNSKRVNRLFLSIILINLAFQVGILVLALGFDIWADIGLSLIHI